jgi:hypothetical protein
LKIRTEKGVNYNKKLKQTYISPPSKVVLIVIITAPDQISIKTVVKTEKADLDSVTIRILFYKKL